MLNQSIYDIYLLFPKNHCFITKFLFLATNNQPIIMKIILFFLLCTSSLTIFAQDTISAGQARDYIEMPMFVKGKVVSFKAAADGKTTNYLNIDRPYPDGFFTVVLSNSYLEKQKINIQDLNQKIICVKGKITTYKEDPKQVPQIFNPESLAVLNK